MILVNQLDGDAAAARPSRIPAPMNCCVAI
jgi:hypothetical protein